MQRIDPREWVYQGWIESRVPWRYDQDAVVRLGNALLQQFPGMGDVDAEQNNAISFKDFREGILRANVTLSPNSISYGTVHLERAEEWIAFNTAVFGIITGETRLFEGSFNIKQLRQSVIITLRDIPDPGKSLFQVIGNPGFMQEALGENLGIQIGVDQEFVFSDSIDGPVNLILRFQTAGPTFVWIGVKDIRITFSVVLDPHPHIIANIARYWKEAEETLLRRLSDVVYPKIIEPIMEKLR